MQISLIITTYNWKEALQLSLQSVLSQTLLPMEIVVADDGSQPDTAELVRMFGEISPVPVVHSWQEDEGYRLARSRNKAIAKAKGEYILLVDGDVILGPHFVSDHRAFAQSSYFIQGTRVLLGQEITATVMRSGLPPSLFFARGVGNRKNCIRSEMLARLFSFESRRLGSVRLCNSAFWKRDALRVNGFNEEFVGWGREDSEFVARLLNSGIKRRNLKFHGQGYHLHHPENAQNRLAANDILLEKTVVGQLAWCEKGLDQHLV